MTDSEKLRLIANRLRDKFSRWSKQDIEAFGLDLWSCRSTRKDRRGVMADYLEDLALRLGDHQVDVASGNGACFDKSLADDGQKLGVDNDLVSSGLGDVESVVDVLR